MDLPSSAEIFYLYTKKRRDFGQHPNFQDSPPLLLNSIEQQQFETLTLSTLELATRPTEEPTDTATAAAAAAVPSRPPAPAYGRNADRFALSASGTAPSQPVVKPRLPRLPFVERLVTSLELDATPEYCETEVNTASVSLTSRGVSHTNGAWPREVDTRLVESVVRYKKKVERSTGFQIGVTSAAQRAQGILRLSNTIDLFEQYFKDGHQGDATRRKKEFVYAPPSTKIIRVFKDPAAIPTSSKEEAARPTANASAASVPKRAASCISWHPTDRNKFAVAYSYLDFAAGSSLGTNPGHSNQSISSYIWDVHLPTRPILELAPASSPLVCLEYNPREPNLLVAGAYNGLVSLWDVRIGGSSSSSSSSSSSIGGGVGGGSSGVGSAGIKHSAAGLSGTASGGAIHASLSSVVETSHREPVLDICWVASKSGMEFGSCSTDGTVRFWDARRMVQPLDVVKLFAPENNSKTNPGFALPLFAALPSGVAAGGVGSPLPNLAPNSLCATALSYSIQAGSNKMLVGTEQGGVYNTTRKPVTTSNAEQQQQRASLGAAAPELAAATADAASGSVPPAPAPAATGASHITSSFLSHSGPVHSVSRHPFHSRYFLSVGDFRACVWSDDVPDAPLFSTRGGGGVGGSGVGPTSVPPSWLSCGCWSPARAGVFFTADREGHLEAYDILSRAADPVCRTKVSSSGARSIRVERIEGSMIAVGDREGTVTLVQVSGSLCSSAMGVGETGRSARDDAASASAAERTAVAEMFEREARAVRCQQWLERMSAKKAVTAATTTEAVTEKNSQAFQLDSPSSPKLAPGSPASIGAPSSTQFGRKVYDFSLSPAELDAIYAEVDRKFGIVRDTAAAATQ
jgi:dynein intermediate chain 2